VQYLKRLKFGKEIIQKNQYKNKGLAIEKKWELVIWTLENKMGKQQMLVCENVIIIDIHKKKSCPFSLSNIASIVWFDYISITFSYLKFVNDLLH
jgi:hypothetical protein